MNDGDNMGFSRLDRKVALLKTGLNNRTIAEAVGVHRTLVSKVIHGERWMGTGARKIMNYISKQTGIPVEEFFPGSNRRKGQPRVEEPEALAS